MDTILGDGTAEEHRGITSSSPTKPGLDTWRVNRAVVFITFITFFDNALYGAVVPFMAMHCLQAVHLTMLQVGVVFSVFGLTLLVGTFLFRGLPTLAILPPRLSKPPLISCFAHVSSHTIPFPRERVKIEAYFCTLRPILTAPVTEQKNRLFVIFFRFCSDPRLHVRSHRLVLRPRDLQELHWDGLWSCDPRPGLGIAPDCIYAVHPRLVRIRERRRAHEQSDELSGARNAPWSLNWGRLCGHVGCSLGFPLRSRQLHAARYRAPLQP